jgi:hypothetical protein
MKSPKPSARQKAWPSGFRVATRTSTRATPRPSIQRSAASTSWPPTPARRQSGATHRSVIWARSTSS